MANFSHWQASLNEYRSAWIIASGCIVTIFLVSVWPGLFSFEASPPASEARQAQSPAPTQQQARFVTPGKEASRSIEQQQPQVSNNKITSMAASGDENPQAAHQTSEQVSEREPAESAVAADNYYVQAGAFKEEALARKLVSKMKEHGLNAIIVPKSALHCVWVGPKNSRDSIETLQKNIERTLNIKGFIVQKRPL